MAAKYKSEADLTSLYVLMNNQTKATTSNKNNKKTYLSIMNKTKYL